jgi:uncharacterized protein
METIKRRDFGKTGLKVTEVSLGAMNLRMLDNEEDAKAVIHRALDLGINLIDTARVYNHEKPDGRLFESEVFVKEAIQEHEALSEPIIIITKGHGYNPKAFDEDLNISRSKLGISGLHDLKIGDKEIKLVYFFHGLSKERFDEMKDTKVMQHAIKRKNEGLFNYLGFSSHNGHEEVICEAIDSGNFEVTELPFNVFSTGFGKDLECHGNIFKRAHDAGMAIINMKAFGGSSMIKNSEVFKDFCDIAPEKRLIYCLSNQYISTVDAGCRFIEELELDIKVSHKNRYSKKETENLEVLAQRVTATMNSECRECTHCLEKFECPQGLDFPSILALHTKYSLSVEFDGDIEEIKNAYSLIKQNADGCIACGECVSWCEYQLDIPKLMEETRLVLRG